MELLRKERDRDRESGDKKLQKGVYLMSKTDKTSRPDSMQIQKRR